MRPITRTSDFKPDTETTIGNADVRTRLGEQDTPIEPVRGTKTIYDTKELLDFLIKMTEENDGKDNWSNINEWDRFSVKYLYDTVFSDNVNCYGLAKKPLINDLGQFCSYCGMRVNDTSLAVEHKLPKSEFPGEMLDYNNLLLACVPCNSSNKGSKPTYKQGKSWAEESDPKYDEVKEAADGYFWWPDDNDEEVYTSFKLNLYNAYYIEYDLEDATNSKNYIKSINNGKIKANVGDKSDDDVTAEVRGDDDRARAMIELVGMNKGVDEKLSDRRMLARTQAWFHAVEAYDLNDQVAKLPDDTPEKDKLVEIAFNQLLSVATDSGFYSVWVKIIYYLSPSGDNSFYEKFKDKTSADKNIYFPGTDKALLP